MEKLANPSITAAVLARHKLRPKKSLGQNFLVDGNTVRRIVAALDPKPEDLVIEIGAGIGTLTQELSSWVRGVVALEVDRNLIAVLEDTLNGIGNVKVVMADARKSDLDYLVRETWGSEGKYKVVGNLPYYVTTPILMHLLESRFNMQLLLIMVQKEVADRICALPDSKQYGALSIAVQYYTIPEVVAKVSPMVFIPRPEVSSAMVRLVVRETPAVKVIEQGFYFKMVRSLFGKRRKTILNGLLSFAPELNREEWLTVLQGAGVDAQSRAEQHSPEQLAILANEAWDVLSRSRRKAR